MTKQKTWALSRGKEDPFPSLRARSETLTRDSSFMD